MDHERLGVYFRWRSKSTSLAIKTFGRNPSVTMVSARPRYGRIPEPEHSGRTTGRHLFWLLTQGNVRRPPGSVLLLGRQPTVGYLRAFRVVAESSCQAFSMATAQETEATGDISLADWELLEPDVDAAAGVVYARAGRSYFSFEGD